MTNPDQPINIDQPDLPEADPRNPLDIRLDGGPHSGKSLRLYPPIKNALLLPTNTDNIPSAPFFAEYRPTDRRCPYTGLRIYTFIGIGIDASSIKAGQPKPDRPKALHPHPKATSYTQQYKKKADPS